MKCYFEITSNSDKLRFVATYQVKFTTWLGSPKAEIYCIACVVPRNGIVICHCFNLFPGKQVIDSCEVMATILRPDTTHSCTN
jgi:predicted amidohydrolase